jgi:hypothetical protein
MKIKSKVAVYAASFSVMTLLCVAVVGMSNPGHAAAGTYTADLNCTDSSTEFNVVVVARVYDYYGNFKGFANNFNFHVNAFETNLAYRDRRADGTWRPWVYYDSRTTTAGYPTGHAQYSNETIEWMKMRSEAIRLWDNGYYTRTGIDGDFTVQMDSNYVTGSASGSGMAPGKGNACQVGSTMAPTYAFRDGDNTHHVTLATANGYGGSASYPSKVWVGTEALGHIGNNNSWSLSCLGQTDTSSTNPIKHMYFTFSQTGWNYSYVTSAQSYASRQNAMSGGWWSPPVTLFADNGQSTYAYMDYHEPAPPTPPTVTPRGSVTNITNPSADAAGYIEPLDFFTASGDVSASASSLGGSVNATWRVWYDTDQDFATATPSTNPPLLRNQTVNLSFSSAGGTQNIGSLAGTQVTNALADAYAWLCSEVIINSVSGSPAPVPSGNPNKRCLHIERRPYFQVMNGDANTAASLSGASGCTANTTSPIAAFNKGAPSYIGSGAGVAAFAAGAITEFTSGGSPKPKTLSFANTAGAGDATYGGGFLGTYCIPDYWGGAAATNATVDASTGTLVTNGDVYITGSPNNLATSFGLGTIPLRWIIANNIYISSGVSYLEGNYVAKGKIYTCATGIGSPVPIASMGSSCGSQLTVYGSFIAGAGVKLQRTSGSLNSAPAETFIYSPDIWIQALVPNTNVPTSVMGTPGKYDSITLLPPVL